MVKLAIAGALALVLGSTVAPPLTVPAGVNENVKSMFGTSPFLLRGAIEAMQRPSSNLSIRPAWTACAAQFQVKRIVACVNEIGGNIMILPNPCNVEFQGEDYASAVCHEKGHILGWRHEYPSFTRMTREAE